MKIVEWPFLKTLLEKPWLVDGNKDNVKAASEDCYSELPSKRVALSFFLAMRADI